MICYEKELTDEEISAINDYWSFEDDHYLEFRFTVTEINRQHKDLIKRSIMSLVSKSSFFLDLSNFVCGSCKQKQPTTNRTNHKKRINTKGLWICSKCVREEKQKNTKDAQFILDEYRTEVFKPYDYLDRLTPEELMALLAIVDNFNGSSQFLSSSLENMSITNTEEIDSRIIFSLLEKKALIHILELPQIVEEANSLTGGNIGHLFFMNKSEGSEPEQYRDEWALTTGVYFNLPILKDYEITLSNVKTIIYQQLVSINFTSDDSARIHDIIKSMQRQKLYYLLDGIQKEYKIKIDYSQQLHSLLDHLANNYAPIQVNNTFHYIGTRTAKHLYVEGSSPFAQRHFFTKNVSSFITSIECKNEDIRYVKDLPNEIEISFFEALFSQIYLNGYFDWNRLSAKKIIALFLENNALVQEVEPLPNL